MTEVSPCSLCGGSYHPRTPVTVPGGEAPRSPSGGIYLVAVYQSKEICSLCWGYIEKEIVRRQRSRPADWDTWVEEEKTYAYCATREITWELLPTGRPKKLTEPMLPPWKRRVL